jgi:hypothetical protein
MLKLKTHSGFHDLFLNLILYNQDPHAFYVSRKPDISFDLRLRKMSHTIYAANGKVIHWHMC